MTDSQDWWPADFGHYGGLFIRMAWHSAGTYRIADGRGGAGAGQQRFAPLNSWPDNANLDKARRLLWPIKQKYGRKISWADLMILAGNVALESMGFKTFGFAGGRKDVWEPEELYWGPEGTWLGDERYSGDRELEHPLGAVQMGLIYVNPEGPNGKPDPVASARDIRETFKRMAMNDEETVALIAGGHTFGKTHGAGDPSLSAPTPEGGAIEDQGLGWKSKHGTGHGTARDHRRPGGHLDADADQVEQPLLREPVRVRMGADEEPGRAPINGSRRAARERARFPIPTIRRRSRSPIDADDRSRARGSTRLTRRSRGASTSIRISSRTRSPARGSSSRIATWVRSIRYLGPLVPKETLIWQDPIPAVNHPLVDGAGHRGSQGEDPRLGPLGSELVSTAWASASIFRGGDKRGGGNGARIRLEPQKDWDVNQPARAWPRFLGNSRRSRRTFNASAHGRQEGLARRPDHSRRRSGDREGGEGRRHGREGPLHAGTDGRLAGGNRRRVLRAARADRRRLPQLRRGKQMLKPRRSAGRQGAVAHADRA